MIPASYAHWKQKALEVFQQKQSSYGESWKQLSLPSLIDMLYVKASRVRTLLQSSEGPSTGEPPLYDWLALTNYAALALLRLMHAESTASITDILQEAQALLEKKNADYGEAWKEMRPLSFIEFILMKLVRIRQMDTQPETHRSLIADNLFDIINYALLYLSRYEALSPSS